MKFSCTVQPLTEGAWLARHTGTTVGAVEVRAPSRQAALDKLRAELQYRIELCPCSGVSGDQAEVVVQDG